MSQNNLKFELVNENEIQSILKEMNKVPKVALNRGVKAGIKIVYEETRKNAPKKTGTLREALIIIKEKNKKFRSGMQVTYNYAFNARLQKKSTLQQNGGLSPNVNKNKLKQGGKKNAYYPASLEYGFEHFYWGKYHGYRHGDYFMRESLRRVDKVVRKTMGDILLADLNKRWEGKR